MAKTSGVDISRLTASELEALKRQIDREIEVKRQKEKDEALKEIRAIADKAGFSLDELVGSGSRRGGRRRTSAATVRYRDPKDASKTWAGRGRKPRWLEEALKEGRKLEEFAV